MAKVWKTRLVKPGKENLLPSETISVRVCSFTFRFRDIAQIREYLAFYEKKIHPSSRVPLSLLRGREHGRGCHVCGERWFERLPMYLQEEPKRQKVVKALAHALEIAEAAKI